MSKDKTTLENFQGVVVGLDHVAQHIGNLHKSIRRDDAEIIKLNSIIDELRDENERLKQEAKGGDA